MNTFYLEILSLERKFYTGECLSIMLPISDGMVGIMANHSPMAAAIPDGEITFTKPDGENVTCVVTNGMADVGNNRVRLLCETAIFPDEINEDEERRQANEAVIEMKKQQSHKDYILWKLSFNKSITRLRIKNKENKINPL